MNFKLALYCLVLVCSTKILNAQSDTLKKNEDWKFNGAVGLDFAQMLLLNPKVGAGENKIAFGGNTVLGALYKKGSFTWKSSLNVNFGVQKLGTGNRPFQKTLDEVRLTSLANYPVAKDNPFGYAVDISMLTQLTPTYEGNYLSYFNTPVQHAVSKLFSPATVVISPGINYKPNDKFSVLISPASYKTIFVLDDSIAMLSNADRTVSMHGTPFGGNDRDEFISRWRVKPTGMTFDSIYYAKNSLQFGATLKVLYQNKFLKDKDGKERIGFSSSLTLFSDYLNKPQFVDVEWLTNTDFYIFKGLSISLGTILFYDYDVLVQLNADKDPNTGVNGYETTGRGLSFTQTLLIKYNFLF
jgi:hypothetical protein